MVVALRALHGQSEQRRRNDLEGVSDDLVPRQVRISRPVTSRVGGHAQESGGDELVEIGSGESTVGRRNDVITRQLLDAELIKRLVRAERAGAVIAVMPRPG